MPNNFQSIVGGIFRGLSNNRSSAGLNQTNTQSSANPLTYQWIGFPTPSDTRQPIQREQTQNPALPFAKGSAGTDVSYIKPILTDIPTLLNQGSPGTNVSLREAAGSVGSFSNLLPGKVATNNFWGSGYGMSPQNADHFKQYFANQIGLANFLPKANANAMALDVSDSQHDSTAGSSDVWKSAWSAFGTMRKGYNPMGTYGW